MTMPLLSDYEELDLTGLEIQTAGWQGERLRANFGSGYGASAVVGAAGGLLSWTLSSGCLPDDDSYGNLIGSLPRFEYYYEFFKRHTTGAQDVFVIEFRGRKYLAEFADNATGDFAMHTIDLFSIDGVKVRQRRVSGFVLRDDGSVFEPSMISESSVYAWHHGPAYTGGIASGWADSFSTHPCEGPSGDVGLTGTQNGISYPQFNVSTDDGYIDNVNTPAPTIHEILAVFKIREATFGNYDGVISQADGAFDAFLVGVSGTTKFTDFSYSGLQYWKNNVSYTAADMQAPMNAFGIVRWRLAAGIATNGIRFGRDRAYSDRYSKLDILDVWLFDGLADAEEMDCLTRWENAYWNLGLTGL